jgi:hypothetical protein
MSELKVNAALVEAYLAAAVMPKERTAFEGVNFTPQSGKSWARLTNLVSYREKVGMASGDSSEVAGILQVDFYYPKGSGTAPMLNDVDKLMSILHPPKVLSYQGQKVKVSRVQRRVINPDDVWQSISVDIYYWANIVQP